MPSSVIGSVNSYFANIEAQTAEQFAKALGDAGLFSAISKYYDITEADIPNFSAELVNEVFTWIKLISPALIVGVLNIYSYFATAFFSLSCKVSKTDIAVPNGKWMLMPSSVSAWIMVVSLALSFLMFRLTSSTVGDVILCTALNVMLLLIPPMFVCGIRGIIAKLRTPAQRMWSIIIIGGIVLLAIFNFVYGIFAGIAIIALEGAFDMILFYRFLKRRGGDQGNTNE